MQRIGQYHSMRALYKSCVLVAVAQRLEHEIARSAPQTLRSGAEFYTSTRNRGRLTNAQQEMRVIRAQVERVRRRGERLLEQLVCFVHPVLGH